MLPHWTPFLDARIVEFSRRYPQRYRLRRDIVNQAVARLDPALAAIPYANSGVPLGHPFLVHYGAVILRDLWRRLRPFDTGPAPSLFGTRGPWTDHAELLRHQPLVEETLAEKADLIRRLPFLDEASVRECYREHLDGANNTPELYALLTFLRMPVVERVVAGSDVAVPPVDEP